MERLRNTFNNFVNIRIYSRSCSRQGEASVAEPPLFWAAPAPEVRGPRADSGSDQIGSASALKK